MSFKRIIENEDGFVLSFEQYYITDDDVRYCITNGPSPYEKSKCNVFIDGCVFSRISEHGSPIFIQPDTGLEIDMCDIHATRNEILHLFLRYGNDPTEYTYDEYEWFRGQKVPFDLSFFHIGHPYCIRLDGRKRTEPDSYQYAILVDMDVDKLVFIYYKENEAVEKEDRNQINNIICRYEVTAERYKRMKKDYWFKSLTPFEKWGEEV